MNRVAEFKKVSFEQFKEDYIKCFGEESDWKIESSYNMLCTPKRSTSGSAGYDFYSPVNFTLKQGESILIPTGIRSEITEGWVLMLYPRSGLGTKFRMQLDNTTGVIDSDYYYSDNEGHIMVKITNDSKTDKELVVKEGERFIQGIFFPYGITTKDNVTTVRNGGFGSTSK